jgi:4a-hydroxytetrahydrobiopterin dehydratase
MLARGQLAGSDGREPYPQDAVLTDRPVAADAGTEHDLDPELFAAFANESSLIGLPGVDLAAGKLPQPGQSWRLGSLRGKHAIAIDDRRTDDHLPLSLHSRAVCHDRAMPQQPLTDDDVIRALAELDGWTGDTGSLRRSVKAPSFTAGISLVDAVAEVAEAMDHHPDIDIRWTTITFTCSTHSAGGVTELDVALARRIDELARG